MSKYQAKRNGKVVWSDETKEKGGAGTFDHFPDKYRDRPESGAVHLYIDDVLIGVQIPLSDEKESS